MNTTTNEADTKAFTLRDDGGSEKQIEAESFADACKVAEDWAREGDYGDVTETIWVDVHVIELDEDGEEGDSEAVTVQINPDEPDCDGEHEHEWRAPLHLVGGIKENPGCWGHGGGVISNEVCIHCGCKRVTDTWAQRPDTGEQGLESVSYEEGAFELHTYAVIDGDRKVVHLWQDARETIGCGTRGNALVEEHDGEEWLACAAFVEVGDRIDENGELLED